MQDPGCVKFFTLEEANGLLPEVRRILRHLRDTRMAIVALQARVDIEEMTLSGSNPDRTALFVLLGELEGLVASFHATLKAFRDMGCELKDLERGLVDFYSMRGNEVVYLCWMDGEDAIRWWHPLDSGIAGRVPI